MTPSQRIAAFIEAATDAVARAIADLHREAARERDLREAEHRARMAEIDALKADLIRKVEDRLATVRDGVDGKDGRDGLDGAPGPAGEPGPAGRDGKDGKDGRDGLDGGPGPAGERGPPGEPGPAGRDGVDGKDGRDGLDGGPGPAGERGPPGEPGPAGRDGVDGKDGRDGLDGKDGAPGMLPIVRAWADGVHYAGDVVTHDGATWQAVRDTGRAPPHEDWVCLAAPGCNGADGRSLAIRGTWNEAEAYRELDVVALNGASFVARRDDPGPCPGEGWQLIAAQGKRGHQGDRGIPGPRGPAGPPVARLRVTDDGLLTVENADGSATELDLYPLLSRIAR